MTISCAVVLENNTITQNVCTSTSTVATGAGIHAYTGSSVRGNNDIVLDNSCTSGNQISGSYTGTYSCLYTTFPGIGNMVDDPEFVDPGIDDFNLLPISPCINAGDPLSPPDPDSTIADIGALYFDCSGGALLIPNSVLSLTFTPNGAQLICTLSWINPSINALGQPLTELSGVKIYRNNVLVNTYTNVSIGLPSTYDDIVTAAGFYRYELIPFNSNGDGIPAETEGWIGLDVPGICSNFNPVPDPGGTLTCNITWDAPTVGAHNGYFPPGSVSGYYLLRAEGAGAFVQIANVTTTGYIDNPPNQGWFTYAVSAYNGSGIGDTLLSQPVFVGPPEFQVIPYNWVEIANIGTNTGITGDDQNLGPFPIGFGFPSYDGNVYNTVRVCSNGWLSFTSTSTAFTNYEIPNTMEPNNLIAPFWDDLYPPGGGTIWYMYDAVNARFIVEWNQVVQYGTTGTPRTFEAILYPNGNIDFMYNNFVGGVTNSATVGIENAGGTVGIQCTYNGSGPVNPVPQMGIRIFSVAPPAPTVNLTLTPINPPIVIPAAGGTFSYDISVQNLGTNPATFQVWNMVILPTGALFGPVWGPFTITEVGGQTISRTRTQSVPASAPTGAYSYISYAGWYSTPIYDSASFGFTKSAILAGNGNPVIDWSNWGEPFPGENLVIGLDLPTEFSLASAYPNPFNPETIISYALPELSNVRLEIFNALGQKVFTLVDDVESAGTRSVTWFGVDDRGNPLSSGMYIYRITAEGLDTGERFSKCEKMLLIR
jgi:hypothetical protein